ncbi:MAG: FlgO family outer membrane protein [Acidobacteriota bacterium]
MIDYSYKACELLMLRSTRNITPSDGVLVASFVNTDKLEESSTFGRAVADQFITGLTLQGCKVSEVKLRGNLLVKQNAGEFMLSRELKNIASNYKAHIVLVGTYARGVDNVYVTAKFIDPTDNSIISAVDYKVKMTADIRKMTEVQ